MHLMRELPGFAARGSIMSSGCVIFAALLAYLNATLHYVSFATASICLTLFALPRDAAAIGRLNAAADSNAAEAAAHASSAAEKIRVTKTCMCALFGVNVLH